MRQANIRMRADAFKIQEPKPWFTRVGRGVACKSSSSLQASEHTARKACNQGQEKCIERNWPGFAKWRVRVQEGVSSPVPRLWSIQIPGQHDLKNAMSVTLFPRAKNLARMPSILDTALESKWHVRAQAMRSMMADAFLQGGVGPHQGCQMRAEGK